MAKADDIRTLAAQRVRELMGKASGWEQLVDVKSGSQTIDLLLKFRMGDRPHAIAIGVTSLGQPRQIREAVTRLSEIRREMPEAYAVATLPVIEQYLADAARLGPHEARAWADEQRELGARGEFYFACIQFCFTATKPG